MLGKRKRTSSEHIYYGLYLLFLGLSLRNTAKALSFLHIINRSHVAIWNWIQRYKPRKVSTRRTKISEYLIDETLIKVGSEYSWLWAAIEPENRQILALCYIQGEEHAYRREIYFRFDQDSRKTCRINRRWNLVPNGL